MQYKCHNCGGELAFDPDIGKLRCKFCDSTYDLSEYQDDHTHDHVHDHDHDHDHDHTHGSAADAQSQSAAAQGYTQATDDSTDVQEDLRLYQCPNCGAEVVTDKSTTATNCVFCNQPLILQEQMQGEFKPDYVIPFEVDKKKIEELYENYIKTKPFYPDEYSTANVIEKIKGVYLPFWLYNFQTTGDLNATGEQTRSFTTRDWIITDHDVYHIYRAGQMDFDKIPVIGSAKTPRDAMDAIEPFDYSKMKPFNTGYLPGFLAERYDQNENQCGPAAHERASNTFDGILSSTIGPFSNIHMTGGHMDHHNKGTEYALMPAWILFMDYDKDEDKLVAINGQTGKIVGNVPVDQRKRNRYFILHFLLIWLLLLIFCLFVLL